MVTGMVLVLLIVVATVKQFGLLEKAKVLAALYKSNVVKEDK